MCAESQNNQIYGGSLIQLTLLHTNDLHGRIQKLSRIVTLVKQIRSDVSQSGGVCFYFDSGDSEETSQLESALTKGSSMETLLKTAGCDQAALGNAIPIRYGPQAVENLAKAFEKPLLCANLFEPTGELVSGLIPFTTLDVKGIKLGIIGLTDPMTVYATAYKIDPQNPEVIMPDLIKQLKSEGVSIVIVLSHLNSTNDIKLAEKINDINVIFSAHDHKRISPPLETNGALIVEAGQYGEVLGRLDLFIDEITSKVIKYQGELIPITDEIIQDVDFLKSVEIEQKRVNKIMSVEIGELIQPVECVYDHECAAGNLLADSLLEYVQGAQVAFVINGHWMSGLDKGKLTQRDLFSANRSTGNPACVKLTGQQILQFLQKALIPENCAKTVHSQRGIPFGWPHVAGMKVIIHSNQPNCLEIQIGGRTLKPDEELLVAASDMEFSEILGYLPIEDSKIEYEVPTILPEVVEAYIKKHSPLQPDLKNRILFV